MEERGTGNGERRRGTGERGKEKRERERVKGRRGKDMKGNNKCVRLLGARPCV